MVFSLGAWKVSWSLQKVHNNVVAPSFLFCEFLVWWQCSGPFCAFWALKRSNSILFDIFHCLIQSSWKKNCKTHQNISNPQLWVSKSKKTRTASSPGSSVVWITHFRGRPAAFSAKLITSSWPEKQRRNFSHSVEKCSKMFKMFKKGKNKRLSWEGIYQIHARKGPKDISKSEVQTGTMRWKEIMHKLGVILRTTTVSHERWVWRLWRLVSPLILRQALPSLPGHSRGQLGLGQISLVQVEAALGMVKGPSSKDNMTIIWCRNYMKLCTSLRFVCQRSFLETLFGRNAAKPLQVTILKPPLIIKASTQGTALSNLTRAHKVHKLCTRHTGK